MTGYDDIVVGAGILGLAHAFVLHRAGRRVLVLERAERAEGASVRNFGMVWPVGQPPGLRLRIAMRSRDLWLENLTRAGLWHRAVGSLHVAHEEDEACVLREFAAMAPDHGYRVQLLSAADAAARFPRLRAERVKAAMWSETEVNVDARRVIAGLAAHLAAEGVTFRYGASALSAAEGKVETAFASFSAGHVWLCPGDDLSGPHADHLQSSGLRRVKLQMLATRALPAQEALGPMFAAGLTLAHYDAFRECPSIATLKAALAKRHPFETRHGIHVMISQNSDGELILGDSHHSGEEHDPFAQEEVDEAILGLLRSYVHLEDAPVQRRWQGSYAKCSHGPWTVLDPDDHTTLITGVGGAGMTLSFGLAERVVQDRIR